MRKISVVIIALLILLFSSCEKPTEPDTTPPTIVITSPENGSPVYGVVTITCESMDDEGVEMVELWVDGTYTGISDTTEPYSLDWDTTPYERGSTYTIRVRSFDTNGNHADSDPITLTIFITFVKVFGGGGENRGHSVIEASDGGYVVVGQTSSSGAGQEDVWLIKTDPLGNMIWEKTYGQNLEDIGKCIRKTSDGGYIITGWISQNRYPWVNHYDQLIWLLKMDSFGDTLWIKTYGYSEEGTNLPNRSWAESGQQTYDGGYIIAGRMKDRIYHEYGSSGIQYGALIKTDATGDTVWVKSFGRYLYPTSVQQTTDRGFILFGNIDPSTDPRYCRVIKADYQGNEVWSWDYYGKQAAYGYSVQQTADGGYIVTGGTCFSGGTYWDAFLIKLDSYGNEVWNKVHGKDTGNDYEIPYSVDQTTDGGYILVGQGQAWDLLVMKTNADGDTLWSRIFDWGEYPILSRGKSIQQTTDGGYVITGYTEYYHQDKSDLLLIKTDPQGNTVPYGE